MCRGQQQPLLRPVSFANGGNGNNADNDNEDDDALVVTDNVNANAEQAAQAAAQVRNLVAGLLYAFHASYIDDRAKNAMKKAFLFQTRFWLHVMIVLLALYYCAMNVVVMEEEEAEPSSVYRIFVLKLWKKCVALNNNNNSKPLPMILLPAVVCLILTIKIAFDYIKLRKETDDKDDVKIMNNDDYDKAALEEQHWRFCFLPIGIFYIVLIVWVSWQELVSDGSGGGFWTKWAVATSIANLCAEALFHYVMQWWIVPTENHLEKHREKFERVDHQIMMMTQAVNENFNNSNNNDDNDGSGGGEDNNNNNNNNNTEPNSTDAKTVEEIKNLSEAVDAHIQAGKFIAKCMKTGLVLVIGFYVLGYYCLEPRLQCSPQDIGTHDFEQDLLLVRLLACFWAQWWSFGGGNDEGNNHHHGHYHHFTSDQLQWHRQLFGACQLFWLLVLIGAWMWGIIAMTEHCKQGEEKTSQLAKIIEQQKKEIADSDDDDDNTTNNNDDNNNNTGSTSNSLTDTIDETVVVSAEAPTATSTLYATDNEGDSK